MKTVKKPSTVGVIRYGLMKETNTDRIMLVGDAALQVKPFSGGGIVYGLKAAEICAKTCGSALENDKFNKKFLKKNYDRKWKNELSLPIMKGMILRRLFNIIPDVGLNFLFYASGHSKKILENWDMDLL